MCVCVCVCVCVCISLNSVDTGSKALGDHQFHAYVISKHRSSHGVVIPLDTVEFWLYILDLSIYLSIYLSNSGNKRKSFQ